MAAKAELHELVDEMSEGEAQQLLGELKHRRAAPRPSYLRSDGSLDLKALWALTVQEREEALRALPAEVDPDVLAEVEAADTDVERHIDE